MPRRTSRRALRIGGLLAALLAVQSCRPKEVEPAPAEPTASAPAPVVPNDDPVQMIYPAAPGSFVDIADQVQRGIVAIKSTRKVGGGPGEDFAGIEDPYALGSGFLVDTSGYILTNDHVIANAPEVRVVLHDGAERAAIVAGRDPRLDIALLKIDGSPRLKPLTLGDSERASVGEWVVAVGNPFGLGATISAGILSAKGDQPIGPKKDFYRSYLQTDAAIHSGNSGGPLVNMQGDVIGINVAIEKRGAPVGYAIPIDVAKQVLPQLQTDGVVSRAWIGAIVRPVTEELAHDLGMETRAGAFISEVKPSGPAAKAGVRRGDVILEYDGHKVDEKSLAWIASTTGIGRTVKVVVWRDGGKRHLDLVTAKMPE